MKATARRRRGKAEIKEQKRSEEQKQSEIVQKLTRIEELENQMRIMWKRADHIAPLEENFQQLVDAGLIRLAANGSVHGVESWEEHQQLSQQRRQEKEQAAQLQQQMQQQPSYVPSEERIRPGQQLEHVEPHSQGSSLAGGP